MPPFLAALLLAGWLVASERKRHEAELKESEAKFRTLLETAPEAVVILDVDGGRFTEVNERAVQLFGRTREELLTMGPLDVSPEVLPDGEPAAPRAAELIAEAVEGGAPVFDWWHRNAAGDLIPCEIRLARLPSRDRTLVRGSVVDITARREAEARQRELEEHLQQSRRLEAVGQLTGGLAHDFNNILTVAMGNLEMALEEARPHDTWAEPARDALEALNRGATLTSRLLAFSRRQPLQPEILNVGDLVAGMTGMLRRTLGETIQIAEWIDSSLWYTKTDRAQLENAILNLALNARDAMPLGGLLSIDVRNVCATPAEMRAWFEDTGSGKEGPDVPASRDFIQISVRDSGTGMDAETAARAFEPFFTTKDAGAGSGLGLSTIYGFVKQSGGHADLRSKPGRGTTVRLFVPRVMERPAVEWAPEPPPRSKIEIVRDHDGRVLVVEDEPGVRDVGVAFLESMGYQCVAVGDAHEALSFLERDTAVDLLFTDVVLPGGISGVELAGRVRAMLPELPIVFCSGYSDEIVEDYQGLQGLGPLIKKPYTRQDLADVLG